MVNRPLIRQNPGLYQLPASKLYPNSFQQMVPPFTAAVVALENGQHSKTAVKTDFGFHIVLREDSRAKQPPAFEAIKKQLLPTLQRQKVQEYLAGLRDSAEVDFLVSEPLEDGASDEPLKVRSIDEIAAEAKPETESAAPAESTESTEKELTE